MEIMFGKSGWIKILVKKVWQNEMNELLKRLLIVVTNLDGFTLVITDDLPNLPNFPSIRLESGIILSIILLTGAGKYNSSLIGEISSIIEETSTKFQLKQTQSQGLTFLEFQIMSS